MKPGKVFGAALLACALLPASAAGSNALVVGDGLLRFEAGPGESNGVTVRYRKAPQPGFEAAGDRFVIDDSVPITGSELCPNLDPKTVSCDARFVGSLLIRLRDGNDVLAINTSKADGVPRRFRTDASGDDGNDVIRGGSGRDRLSGGDGRDVVAGWIGDDVVLGGNAIDAVIGFGGDDRMMGGPGADVLFALKGHDSLFGGGGPDILIAKDGQKDPKIRCGPGKDGRATMDRHDPEPRSCFVPKPKPKPKPAPAGSAPPG